MSEKRNIDELIIHYLQQDIEEDALRVLEAWLDEDIRHKVYFFQMKNVSDFSRRSFLPYEEVTEANWEKMKILIQESQENSSSELSVRRNISDYYKYVAIIIIALGVGWGISKIGMKSNKLLVTENIVANNEIRVDKGGKVNSILLSDGTKVILNASTTFRYPANFGANERFVFLDGEAYFDVAKNLEKPFKVKLKNQDVVVLGTQFNIDAYSDDSCSVITLLSGSIALESFNEKGESMNRTLLKPNQKARVHNQTGSISIQEADGTLSNAWVKGFYKFESEPLSSIAKRLEYYYGVKIHLKSESLMKEKYTGTFSLEQDVKEILKIIDYENKFIVEFKGNAIYITDK